MRNIIALLAFCFSSLTLAAQTKYDAAEIRQLVDFLNHPSGEQAKTNAQAIGITVQVTKTNIAEWYKNLGIYTTDEGGIWYIRDISLENKGRFRLGGSFRVENFKHLETLGLYGMGCEVKVKNCPELAKFRLMGEYGKDEHCKERRLEITGCPKLWQFRIDCLVTEFLLDKTNALAEVDINYTALPFIDFSSQIALKRLILNNSAFRTIQLPANAQGLRFECRYNQITPVDLIDLVRKTRGDELALDWSFPPMEYTPQCILDTLPYGTKIDLRALGTFTYGNPEKTYTGTFKWQCKNGQEVVDILPATADMKRGIYTLPASMVNRTIIVTYACEPFSLDNSITWRFTVVAPVVAGGGGSGSGSGSGGSEVPIGGGSGSGGGGVPIAGGGSYSGGSSGGSYSGGVSGGTKKPSDSSIPPNWYNLSNELKKKFEELKNIENEQERADQEQQILLELKRLEKIYAIEKMAKELRAEIEKSVKTEKPDQIEDKREDKGADQTATIVPADQVQKIFQEVLKQAQNVEPEQPTEPVYERGEDIYVEFIPPTPLYPMDNVILDMDYIITSLNYKVEKPDYRMSPVLLNLKWHKTRPGDEWTDNHPVILLDLLPKDYDRIGRDVVFQEKPCREIIVEIPFYHDKNQLIPAHIICPRPAYEGDSEKLDREIAPSRKDRVFVAMRIFQKEGATPEQLNMGVWTQTPQKPLEYTQTAPIELKFTVPDISPLKIETEWLKALPAQAMFVSAAVSLDPAQAGQIISYELPFKEGYVIKKGDEWFVRVSLANVGSGTIIPCRIFAPLPADQNKPVEELSVKAGDNKAVYFHVKVTAPTNWSERHVSLHVMSRFVRTLQVQNLITYPEYAYCRDYGLITLKGTGKYADHCMALGTMKDQWMEVIITPLGQKYLKPEDKWSDTDKIVLAQTYSEWSYLYDSELIEEHTRALGQGWGFPERGHAGEPKHIRAVFDGDAIRRDIAAGILKAR